MSFSELVVSTHSKYLLRIQILRSQDGGGIGWGDHVLSYKFIERTIEW